MKSFLFLLFLIGSRVVEAQPEVSIYAYSQVFTPGMIRQRDVPAENGSVPVKAALSVIQYYIYVAVSPSASLQLKEIWIKGQRYKIKRVTVVQTPVKIETPSVRVLVPASRQKVIKAEPGDSLPVIKRPFPALKKMMKQSELIVSYSWDGKVYFTPVRKITVLETVHAQ